MKSPINPTVEIPHPPVVDTTKEHLPTPVIIATPVLEPATGTPVAVIRTGGEPTAVIPNTTLKPVTVTDAEVPTQFKS